MLSFQTVAINTPDVGTSPAGEAVTSEMPTGQPTAAATVQSQPVTDGLTVIDLCKSFRSGFLKRRIRGIEGVSFNVPKGEVFALLGHNGAGKTTTINCILDLVHPDRGEVRIMGTDHRQRSSRTRVGYLPERPYFFEHLSGRELLEFYADLLELKGDLRQERINFVLDRTGMSAYAGRRLRKFSKGMLQRIGLAQTLLGDPDLLILDEPMSGLDPMGRREVRELLLELKAQGKTIILSSHIVPDVEMLADSVGIMRDGHMVATRDMREINTSSSYRVHLAHGSHSSADLALPNWARDRMSVAGANQMAVDTKDVDQLRELLAACHTENIMVQSVETVCTGLEDTFMAVHADHAPEVVS